MMSSRFCVPWLVSLALAGSVVLSSSGCGGKGPDTGEAIVIPEPNANVPTAAPPAPAGGASGTSPVAAPSAAAPAEAAAPATAAEGWGTLKGKVTLKGDAPKPKELVAKGAAPKDPTICASDAPIVSE